MMVRTLVLCCAAGLLYAVAEQNSWAEAPAVSPQEPMLVAQQKEPASPKAGKEAVPTKGAPASPTSAPGEATAPQAPSTQVGEFQPVLHAQGAKISTCMDTIVGESASVIDSAHTAISSWSNSAPDANEFLSIVGLSYANKAAPNAAAVMMAAPLGSGKCQGATVQVYPVAQPCSALQASLIKEGHTIASLGALPVVETKAGSRDVLIPTTGNGCVLIAVRMQQ
jgi:hypothetical protein